MPKPEKAPSKPNPLIELLRSTDLQYLKTEARQRVLGALEGQEFPDIKQHKTAVAEQIEMLFTGRELPEGMKSMREKVLKQIKEMKFKSLQGWIDAYPEIDFTTAIRKGLEWHLTEGYIEDAVKVASTFPDIDFTPQIEKSKDRILQILRSSIDMHMLGEARKIRDTLCKDMDVAGELREPFMERLRRKKFSGARKILDGVGKGVDFSAEVKEVFEEYLETGDLKTAQELVTAFGPTLNLSSEVRRGFESKLTGRQFEVAAAVRRTFGSSLDLEPEIRRSFVHHLEHHPVAAVIIKERYKDLNFDEEIASHELDIRRGFVAVLQDEGDTVDYALRIRHELAEDLDFSVEVQRGVTYALSQGEVEKAKKIAKQLGKDVDLDLCVRDAVRAMSANSDITIKELSEILEIAPNVKLTDEDLAAWAPKMKEGFLNALLGDDSTDNEPDAWEAGRLARICRGKIDLSAELIEGVQHYLDDSRGENRKETIDEILHKCDPVEARVVKTIYDMMLGRGDFYLAGDFRSEHGKDIDFAEEVTANAERITRQYEEYVAHEFEESLYHLQSFKDEVDWTETIKKCEPKIHEEFCEALAEGYWGRVEHMRQTLAEKVDFEPDIKAQEGALRGLYLTALAKQTWKDIEKIQELAGSVIDFSSFGDEAVLQILKGNGVRSVGELNKLLSDHNIGLIQEDLATALEDPRVQRHFTPDELGHGWEARKNEIMQNPKEAAIAQREQLLGEEGYLQQEDYQWYERLKTEFGSRTVATFLGTQQKSYLHIAGPNVIKLYEHSGLKPTVFVSQVLLQVADDNASYGSGMNSHAYFNTVIQGIDFDVQARLTEARQFQNPQLQELIAAFESDGICTSWKKHLQKYYELCQILRKRDVLVKLEALNQQGRQKQYAFFSRLAFHPNISMEQVFLFMEQPARFLDVADVHQPQAHERKKPSNYVKFDHLDLTAEDLRDALAEGDLDALQYYPPFQADYVIPREDCTPASVLDALLEALGERAKQRQGRARNIKRTFQAVQEVLKRHELTIQDVKQRPESMSRECQEDLERVIYDPKDGLKDDRKIDEYRLAVHAKSSPDGLVAGNDTACCMPFGSGKNNVYMYNLGCATLTVQRKTGGTYRTIAQSVLTPDINIEQSIAELVSRAMQSEDSLHSVVKKDLSAAQEHFVTADNIEVAANYKNPEQAEVLRALYADFCRRYVQKMQRPYVRTDKVIIGKGYTDLPGFQTELNTYIPSIPPGYSDNLAQDCYVIPLQEQDKRLARAIVTESDFTPQQCDPTASTVAMPKGIRSLTAIDAVRVSYMEGKIYAENESLIQYIHRIGNELIAKDINNQRKKRPNLSLIAEDESGNAQGYMIAYEGVADKREKQPISVVYISDLAAKSKIAGGRLTSAFLTLLEEEYLSKGKLIPIVAEAREGTSYQLIQNHLEEIGSKYGVRYEMEELDHYRQGKDMMRVVVLKPRAVSQAQ